MMTIKNLLLPTIAFLFTHTAALGTTLTCTKANGPWLPNPPPLATLTYDLESSDRGSLEVLGESYSDSVELKFSRQGPLTHGFIPGVVDFRVQSLMPTTHGLLFAKLAFPQNSPSAQAGKTFALLCRRY